MIGSVDESLSDFLLRTCLAVGLLEIPSSLQAVVKARKINDSIERPLKEILKDGDLMYLFCEELPNAIKIKVSLQFK